MAEFHSFANMTEWMIGWAAVGFVSIVQWTGEQNPFAGRSLRGAVSSSHSSWIPQLTRPWMIVFIGWCTCFGLYAGLQNAAWSLALMTGLAVFVGIRASNFRRKITVQEEDSPTSIHSRLIQLRLQLQRLHEKERLSVRLEKAEQSQMVLDRYDQRFQVILLAIENHLMFGDHGRAERIITLFSRHLRHILYEGSVPFLTLETTIEHIKTHLSLMELLTAGRFNCDIDDGMLEAAHFARCTESLRISPWVESMVWPFFEWAERHIEPIDPMQLLLDVEDGEITLTCAHPSLIESQIVSTQRLKLLGDYAQSGEETVWEQPLKVVA